MAKMDDELKALTAVERAIAGLTPAARDRVLRNAVERSYERAAEEKRALYEQQAQLSQAEPRKLNPARESYIAKASEEALAQHNAAAKARIAAGLE